MRAAPHLRFHWFGLLALVAATLLAYQPVWHGGILWDDAGHLTRPDLRPISGLWRIWFVPGATQQYYPVVHSVFWLLHHFWGDSTTGYHFVNIILHAVSAWLLWRIVLQLGIPGAALAAAVFALHPVHVESVAWITELKNVLSGVFYLAAALAYLRFERDREISPAGRRTSLMARGAYALAFVLFVLAVLSKSVTASLPAALLVVFWWQRGRLNVRRDVMPLIPFFVVGAAAGLTTIWMERTSIGATGAEFDLSWTERMLLASRAVWFYAGTLIWPMDLTFIYPRWTIRASDPMQCLWLAALLLAFAGAWMMRRHTRAPLCVLLLYVGTLFPALGFFNVYPFLFSYVADHFQYHASIAPIVAACGTLTLVAERTSSRVDVRRVAEFALSGAAALVLGLLTWRQAHMYADAETLYRTTISRNPSAWLAHNNLASLLLEGEPPVARVDEAMRHLATAIQLKPDYVHAWYNRATALERLGRRDEAAALYAKVLELDPGQPRAIERLAAVNHDRATALLERALVLEKAQRFDDAAQLAAEAVRLDPARAALHEFLGRVLHSEGRLDEAARAYEGALALNPDSFEVHSDLAVILVRLHRLPEALTHFETAVRLRPGDATARANLASVRAQLVMRR